MKPLEKNNPPLADQVRPSDMAEFFVQSELLGENSFLRAAIQNDRVPSMIFWGPPGCGKTTLAHIIAESTDAEFIQLSAVASGKKDLLQVLEKAKNNITKNKKTILFVDEIHRWTKTQQDALLPAVETGIITLIGATTENPSFEVNSALISRTRVVVFQKLEEETLEKILTRAVKKKYPKIKIKKDVVKFIIRFSNGDARAALNTLEAAANSVGRDTTRGDAINRVSTDMVKQILQKTHLLYDKNGEEHYNIISALHKSMRGGDADAAVYWLARML